MRSGLLRWTVILVTVATMSSARADATRVTARDLRERALILQAEDERDPAAPVLARACSDRSPELRARAVRALGRIGETSALDLLRTALADPVSSVRHEAAFALGEVGAPEAFDALAHALGSSDDELAALAAEAMAKLRWPDPQQRARAGGLVVRRFLWPGAKPPTPILVRVLHDAWAFGAETPLLSHSIRHHASAPGAQRAPTEAALHCAARLRDPSLADVLLRTLRHGPSPRARAHAARGLGALASAARGRGEDVPDSWLSALLRAAMDDRPFAVPEVAGSGRRLEVGFREVGPSAVRIAALRSLGAFDPPEPEARAAAPALRALRSEDPGVQVEALALAERWRTPALAPALKAVLADRTRAELHPAALGAWAALGGTRAMRELRDFAESRDWRRRAATAGAVDVEALAEALDGRLLQDRLLLDRDPRVVATALGAALASGRDDAAVLALGQLASADVVVRAVALDALPAQVGSRLSRAEAAEPARRAWHAARADADPDARLAALGALVEILGPDAAPDLALALQDPSFPVRLRARAFARELGLHALAARPVGPVGTGRGLAFYEELAASELGEPPTLALITDRGIIDIDLFPSEAPMTVAHLVRLAADGYFDGLRFHRVVPDFVAQGGDPRGDGWGGPGTSIRCEINQLRYDRGSVGMALAGKDTGGSQFFLTLSPQPHLDGGYTIFGRVREDSLAAMDAVRRFDRILAAIPRLPSAESARRW